MGTSTPPDDHDSPSPAEQRYHEAVGDTQLKLSLRTIPELKKSASCAQLQKVSVLEAVDLDARPTFAISVSSDVPTGPLEFIHINPALAAVPWLLSKVHGNDSPNAIFTDAYESHVAYKNWLFGQAEASDEASPGSAFVFADYLWWSTSVGLYSIVSGTPVGLLHLDRKSRVRRSRTIDSQEHSRPQNHPQFVPGRLPAVRSIETSMVAESLKSFEQHPPGAPIFESQFTPTASSKATLTHGPFDYTLDPPPSTISDHIKYFRSVAWEKTPLGPMQDWCPQLRCMVNMIMNDSYPAVLFWGQEVTMIYNESYIEIIGLLHPCMGQSARVAAKDYWPHFEPIVQHINATGQTISNDDLPLFLDRHGFLEETFFSFQFTPILNDLGNVAGYYQPLVETTKNGLLERRVSSLVEVGSQTAKARDLPTYWDLVINTLAINDKDAPFALLYAAESQHGHASSSISSPSSMSSEVQQFELKGSIGADSGHAIAPSIIDLRMDKSTVFHPYLVKTIKSRKPVVVHFSELDLPKGTLDGIKWKGYGDPCRSVIVCPILPTTSEQIQGFLILGINPRRPFDEDYQQYVHVTLRLLATSLASVVLFDEEIRQKENAIGQAARIQEQLLDELQLKEKKFQRFAERSDVAIFIVDGVGKYSYRNQSWYDLFESAVEADDVMGAWTNIVFPEDIARCEGLFSKLAVEKSAICFELKTTMPWTPPASLRQPEGKAQEHFKWILCSAYPELDAKGEIIEIVGNVTDISKLKWAEGVQKIRMNDALDSKKHLEHFIDTTSHEMRNPLSAIMQCADGILAAQPPADNALPMPSPNSYASILDQTLDAAQTIAQCAQHMRIVDDILTVSKLDSGLLAITPIDAQPESVASHAVKMFESEAKAADVDMTLHIDSSFRDLQVDWMSLDPTRLLQVLINLITNALKFTRLEATRRIKVTVAASKEEPTSVTDDVLFETKLAKEDPRLVEDWKMGSTLYLRFFIADTGRGLSEHERSTLFGRFAQASPRTHINYGGSGLGLFISRRLTELQGGAIGLSSEPKKGSTFSFYIKTRRSITVRSRRSSSLPDVFPEDMRHRATTRQEIDQLRRPVESPAREHRNPTSSFKTQSSAESSQRSVSHESKSPSKRKAVRPSIVRQQSALNSDVPAEAIGLPPRLNLRELKRANSIPRTLHVLVVEDNLVNQKVLAKQLRNLGCIVSVANHGVEALDFLKTTRHWSSDDRPSTGARSVEYLSPEEPIEHFVDLNVILMDWEMPIMNGLEATSQIRQLESSGALSCRIPVIGVTANVRQQQIQMAMDAGMDDVVSKPFRVAELMGRMRGIVQGIWGKDGENFEGNGGE
ncbi:unnamed protein product [Periconia digitata]|uniref:Uncharacterized protein n=1 Tax=Periconia digitata TaxID=1303443 RepID=A0A9W4UTZ0_9PLEO|nr:unnamed protein product [Periconia digitata]